MVFIDGMQFSRTKHTHLILIFLTSILYSLSSTAQSYYDFIGNLSGPVESRNTSIAPLLFEANEKGGIIRLAMPDTAEEHSGVYEFQWKFIDDIKRMYEGKEYRFGITGRRIKGTAEKNSVVAHLKSSNSGSKLADKEGYKAPGNTIILEVPTSQVKAYPKAENNTVEGVIKVRPRMNSYFSIDFSFSSHPYSSTSKKIVYSVVYVFESTFIKR